MRYKVEIEQSLLDFLSVTYKDSSKTTLRSWIKEGRVSVDEQTVTIGSALVYPGQTVTVGKQKILLDGNIEIIYADDHIVVIDKPSGMLSVAAAFEGKETAHAILKARYRPRKVQVIHRLDQDTSGVMVFALTEQAALGLKDAFKRHDLQRSYTAIIEGHLSPPSGTWQSYLIEDGNYYVHTTDDKEAGELAITHYTTVYKTKHFSWLCCTLETGKKNQIRVQAKEAGHPIVGDKKYGATYNPFHRLCLHAHLLAFTHPITKASMRFESPVPSKLQHKK